MQWIQAGGFFSMLIMVLGVVSLVLLVMELLSKRASVRGRWAVSLMVAMVCLGVVGTSIGLFSAIGVYQKFPVAQHTAILAKVLGMAMAPLGLASLWCALHVLLLGWGWQRAHSVGSSVSS